MKKIPCVIIVFLLTAGLFPAGSSAQNFVRDEDYFALKGANFEYKAQGMRDEQTMMDPITGDELTKVIYSQLPSTVNGKKIYEWHEVTSKPQFNPARVSPPAPNTTDLSLEEYLLNNLKSNEELKQIPDGILRIHLHDIVIDDAGKVVFFDYNGLRWTGPDKQPRAMGDGEIPHTLDSLMANVPPFQPATYHGNAVPVRLEAGLSSYKLTIKNHLITWVMDKKNVPLK